jgi:hypothetical protein
MFPHRVFDGKKFSIGNNPQWVFFARLSLDLRLYSNHYYGIVVRNTQVESEKMVRDILGYSFRFITEIEPDRDQADEVKEFFPQGRYRNEKNLLLNKHGTGPFCRFRIPRKFPLEGVYTITVDDEIIYVGESQNLPERFNAGYGNISPRNCFEGGQSTNCRINHYILRCVKQERKIELWFLETSNRGFVETELIQNLQPPCNDQYA